MGDQEREEFVEKLIQYPLSIRITEVKKWDWWEDYGVEPNVQTKMSKIELTPREAGSGGGN